jgi:hypothetical protein
MTRWMVVADGYAVASLTATWANSKPERSGVANAQRELSEVKEL